MERIAQGRKAHAVARARGLPLRMAAAAIPAARPDPEEPA
ncbi:hypothetical protein L494_2953 [Bordetella bronchiseptica CA90 BB1334]|nr:hypothetical protein L494_2953 [Bordetella bronchiseptica CA90 BB1334]KDD47436.1 hypothetical protein L532_2988 [Bordetella bronchiseptica OSU095]